MRVLLFGEFRFLVGARQVFFDTQKAASLFAFLLLKRGRWVSREKLWGVLWSDASEERARRNLSTTLWRVRRAILGVDGISINLGRVLVKLEAPGVYVDVDEFRNYSKEAETADLPRRKSLLEAAEALYTGDLLEGFAEDWCEEERRHLHAAYQDLLRKLSGAFMESSDFTRAVTYLEKLVRLEPLDEEAHRDLMRVYHILGRRSAALAQFSKLKSVLKDELGIEPSAHTVQLFEHIRTHGSDALSAGTGKPSLSAGGTQPFGDLPLIGREEDIRFAIERLDKAARGQGSAIVLVGDLGVGKTRLVRAVMTEAELRGFDVLQGGCPDLEAPPPYQVFIQAVWPRIVEQPAKNEGFSKVVSYLTQAFSPQPSRSQTRKLRVEIANNAILNEWILSFLDPRGSRPTLVVLEDIHRIDKASEQLLAALLKRIPGSSILLLLTVRSGELESEQVVSTVSAGGAEVRKLAPLRAQDVTDLIAAALGRVISIKRLARFACERTGGLPLFVIELVKFLLGEGYLRKTSEGLFFFEPSNLPRDFVVPAQVLEIIRRRIERIKPRDKYVLCCAAILGTHVQIELLEHLLGTPEDEFAGSLDRLTQARLLSDSGASLVFPHESIRLAALRTISRAHLKRLHLQAACTLEHLMPGRTADIAWHYLESGCVDKAVGYFEVSGDSACMIHANEDACRFYTRALDALKELNAGDAGTMRRTAALLLKRQEALDLIGNRTGQARDIEAVLQIASALRDRSLVARGMFHRSQVLCRMNLNREAVVAGLESERLFMEGGNVEGAARAAEAVGTAYINLRNQKEARKAFGRSLALFRRARNRAGEARALVNLGTVITFAGRNPEGMEYLDQAEDILRELDDKRALAGALLQKGVLLRCMGQGLRSESFLLEGISIMRKIGDRVGEARGLSQLAATRMTLGKLRDGLHESVRAIRLAREAKDTRAEILFMNNAAYSVFRCIGDFDRAERLITRAIRLVSEAGGIENSAIYYDTMAAILLERGDNESALRWARRARSLYRRWVGHFDFVGNEIDFRLGLAYVQVGRHDRALPLLLRAVDNWRKNSDVGWHIHGLAALADLYLERGEHDHALGCAREAERLLRTTDGLEQIQKIYWTEFRVFQRIGAHAAAKRALRKAHSAVISQARALKGRYQRRFLQRIRVNSMILREVGRAGPSHQGADVGEREFFKGDSAIRIAQRRRTLLGLLTGRALGQKEIASRLGVSVRTIRYDLVALRNRGLIDQRMKNSVESS